MPANEESQLASDLLAASIHEIKNRFGLLFAEIDRLLAELPLNDRHQESSARIKSEAQFIGSELVRILASYKTLGQTTDANINQQFLLDFLEEKVARHGYTAQANALQIEFDCDEDLTGFFDAGIVNIVLDTAIYNAVKEGARRILMTATEALFAWVGVTIGVGGQNSPPAPTPGNTYQGGEALGFYNMQEGDASIFNNFAHQYAISDNYHQAVMGGTGANFLALVTGDVGYYTDGNGPTMPPANQIENPDPQQGTNNFYTQDGYGGGSYVNCSDSSQPGVAAIDQYLRSLPYKPFNKGNCADNTYYLVNNYNLGYDYKGDPRTLGSDKFVLPPQTIPTIADALSARNISWKYYIGGRQPNGAPTNEYCGICDPLTGFTSIMTTSQKNNLQGMEQFYQDVKNPNTLPAVSYIRPFESDAGHPADATVPDFEKFVQNVVQRVQANPEVWRHTAILVTVDEGGGYYDSGYIQPIDFFGDGTRIPLIAISPYAKRGYVDHSYADHASILKFIERNWGLPPLSDRSRDNLPNPVTRHDPYVPVNRPAIDDLMSLFNFHHHGWGWGQDDDQRWNDQD